MDGSSQVCRVVHLDETSLPFPATAAAPAAAEDQQWSIGITGTLPGITLSDNVDLNPLLENGNSDPGTGLSPFGPHASIRFDVWIPPSSHNSNNHDYTGPLCVPSSLTLIAGPGSLTVPIPSPQHDRWTAGKWHSINAPINTSSDGTYLKNEERATWNALTRLELNYHCVGNTTKTSSSSSTTNSISTGSSSTNNSRCSSIKIQLIRVCKGLSFSSFCTVTTTAIYKTECRECRCQTCHKEDCKCLTTYPGTCPFDNCSDCPCAPICQCCYESKCDYPCNCETCCESRSFTSCTRAITFEVASLAPAGGVERGGAHVILTSTSSFVATAEMACRFGPERNNGREGGVIVPATLLSSRTLACVAPPYNATVMTDINGSSSSSNSSSSNRGKSVVVEVSLNGQQWTRSGRTFHYCPSSSSSSLRKGDEEEEEEIDDERENEECLAAHDSCLPGWTGKNCTLKCPGNANNPCNGEGFCLAVGTGEEGMDEEEASCVCKPGFEGVACDVGVIVASSTTESSNNSTSSTSLSKTVASSSISSEPGSSSSTDSSAMRQGLLLGMGACLLLLTLAAVAVYVKRVEVLEFIFWTLAASRFERLQHGQEQGDSLGEVEEGRQSVELTAASSSLQQLENEEVGEVTVM
ncbi:hypothetical protein VYU27_004403 [Nannochloropsis oceanica]